MELEVPRMVVQALHVMPYDAIVRPWMEVMPWYLEAQVRMVHLG